MCFAQFEEGGEGLAGDDGGDYEKRNRYRAERIVDLSHEHPEQPKREVVR